jgi:dipeptidase E
MRRILCIGGHGFSARPADRAMTDFVVSLARSEQPRICLLPTASGDAAEQSSAFNTAMSSRGCIASELSLFRLGRRPIAVRDHLLAQDLIYVGGGNLLNLMAVWEAHDLGAILRLAWGQGIPICGQSAGAMCWFEVGITTGAGRLRRAAGLGILPGSCSVHYHSEPDRRQLLLDSVATGGPSGYGIDDHAALLWNDRRVAGPYSSRQGATIYRVKRDGPEVVERAFAASAVVPEGTGEAIPADISEFRRTRSLAVRSR